jgi:hypothetical protein
MASSDHLPSEGELDAWLSIARDHEGRSRLLSDGTIARAAQALEPAADAWRRDQSEARRREGEEGGGDRAVGINDDDDDGDGAGRLLLLLRLLRNTCAGGAPAANLLLLGGQGGEFARVALELAGELASRYAVAYQRQQQQQQHQRDGGAARPHPPAPPPPPPLLLAAVQMVANLSVAAAAAAGAAEDVEGPGPGGQEEEQDGGNGGSTSRSRPPSSSAIEVLWPQLIPVRLRQLTAVPEARVHAPATLAALQMVRCSAAAARALCGGGGGGSEGAPSAAAACWRQLLAAALGGEGDTTPDHHHPHHEMHVNDCLPLLMRAVALRRGLLGPLLRCLDSGGGGDGDGDDRPSSSSSWNACHVAVLHLLAHEVGAVAQAEPPGEARREGGAAAAAPGARRPPPAAATAVEALLDALERAAADVAAEMALDDDVDAGAAAAAAAAAADNAQAPGATPVIAPPKPTPAVRALEAALHALKAVAAREDRGAGLLALSDDALPPPLDLLDCPLSGAAGGGGDANATPAAATTLGARLAELLVALMVALGPPVHPRRPEAEAGAGEPAGATAAAAATQQEHRRLPLNASEAAVLALSSRFPPAASRRMAAEADAVVRAATARAEAAAEAARARAAAEGRPFPPPNPFLRLDPSAAAADADATAAEGAAPPSPSPPPRPALPGPYQGYRADACACLANALHNRPRLADALLEAAGLDPLLQSSALDASAPLAREWALWGVRNACEASERARAYVASLEASGVVSSPELARAGLAVELDRRTGKARVVPVAAGARPPSG